MKNKKRQINPAALDDSSAFDGGGIGLIVFAAAAVWLLLFQSNLFQ